MTQVKTEVSGKRLTKDTLSKNCSKDGRQQGGIFQENASLYSQINLRENGIWKKYLGEELDKREHHKIEMHEE